VTYELLQLPALKEPQETFDGDTFVFYPTGHQEPKALSYERCVN